jgi:sec-independent protein translocase protein TatA
MFGTIGAPEIAIIAVVLILLFGVGKLSGLGKDLGSGIKEFRRAMKDEDKEAAEATTAPTQPTQTVAQQPQAAPQQAPAANTAPQAPASQDSDKPAVF